MEELTLETISRHIKKMKGIRRRQHGFTKGKPCLTNLRAFCDEMTGLVGEGTEVDIVYLDVSKTVDTVSHKILIERPLMYRLDEKTVRWVENRLNDWVHGAVVSGTKFSWSPVTSVVPQDQCWV